MRGAERLEIGGVARAHGIRGEIVIVTHDPDSSILETIKQVWIGGTLRTLVSVRATPDRGFLVYVEGVTTRNDAELLRGQTVEIERSAIPIADDEFLLDDLVGCKVVRADGTAWGEIVEIILGKQDRLVIHDGEIERELPFVDEFVLTIDIDAGVVTVDPPDGLPENRISRPT
jgi:16S rRNA processing protein RimM